MTNPGAYQAVLKRIAAVAVALGTSTASASEELSAIPLEVVESIVESEELDNLADPDRARLLQVLAADPRTALRVRVAQRIAKHPSVLLDDDTETLIEQIARDPARQVRAELTRSLCTLLPRLTGLERTSFVGRWATSHRIEQRRIIAKVLQHRFPVLWDDAIVEHLMRDADPAVRVAAFHAAAERALPV